MARYKAKHDSDYLGTECLDWHLSTERLAGSVEPLLWQVAADLDNDTVGRVWRISVRVRYEAATRAAFNSWFEALVASLDANGLATLTVENFDTAASVATYANCRFDVADAPVPAPGAGHFSYDTTFSFTRVN